MKKALYTIAVFLIITTPCLAGVHAKSEVKKGNLLYNKAEFEESLKKYEKALTAAPESNIVNFDLGAALYKLKDYERALEHFKRSLVTDDEALEQKANYNLGNAEYKFGITKEESDLQGAVGLLQEALRHYEKALTLDIDDEDARDNYEFVKKELERLKERLKQQEQQKKGEQKEEKERQEEKAEQQEAGQQQPQQQQEQQQQARQEEAQEQQQKGEAGRKEEEKGQMSQAGGGAEEQDEEGGQEQASGQGAEGMSQKQALMLLEGYRQEEEPKGLYREKTQMRDARDVVKDW